MVLPGPPWNWSLCVIRAMTGGWAGKVRPCLGAYHRSVDLLGGSAEQGLGEGACDASSLLPDADPGPFGGLG